MCSIAGIYDTSHVLTNQQEIFKNMIKSMKHRGPDDEGMYVEDHVALLHTRLAIMDPEKGIQPMFEQEYGIVYNGELYNADEIRNELKQKGVLFQTNCDTEVVLKAYISDGIDCLRNFNGIFAFAIYNKLTQDLFLARDPFGVKPLFYSWQKNTFLFASEIKTLLTHPLVPPVIQKDAIHQLFYLGPGRKLGSGLFKDIYEVLPGEYLYIKDQTCIKQHYHQLQDHEFNDDLPTTLATVEKLVQDAIERQLMSDVELGCLLSGGLDSSIITSIAARYMQKQDKQLKTFSLHYVGNDEYFKANFYQPNSDDPYIDEMVKAFDTDHTRIFLTFGECLEALYEAVDARDLPGMADIDSSLLLFCKKIKQKVKVCLSGECADEIFGGYPWYFDEQALFSDTFPWIKSLELRQAFLLPQWQINPQEYVTSYVKQLHQDLDLHPTDEIDAGMKKLTYLNMMSFMQTLLERKDRMSMACGLEVRVPFCDVHISEYLFSTPWLYKIYTQREKGLLREAMKNHLPNSILHRKKSPYPKTHHPAYLTLLRKELEKLLHHPYEPIFQIVDSKVLEKLLTEEATQPWYGQLMTTPQTIAYMLQINYWLKKYKVRIEE